MRTPLPLALSVWVAAGCSSTTDPPCAPADGYVPQLPVAGLSVVDTPPAVPQQDTLAPNPALVDGDVAASAGIDLGYAPTLAGDLALRDVGLQLTSGAAADALYVWVDRALPPEVASACAWAAYRSDDNVNWTPIAAAGPVLFGVQSWRFEIPIARTQARYVKAVARPLAVGVTSDPRFASVLVTEAQAVVLSPTCGSP